MDDPMQIDEHQLTRHEDYTNQLKRRKLKNNNRYINNNLKGIDYLLNFILFSIISSKKQCLLTFIYLWLLVCLSLFSLIDASQTSLPGNKGPNLAQNNPSFSQSPRTVATKYGILRGTIITLPNVNLQQVEAFLGVPYANPPTGKLRLMPPVTSSHFSSIKEADKFAPACPQPMLSSNKNLELSSNLTSEDCLYLNIYTPISVHQHNIRLPVMVFIHGGNFETGAGSDYDGSVLSSYGNVIVVTLNYRLGLLGFFPTMEGTARGNYGLMDQVAALHWLQENIAEFGGLSNNVTVFGSGSGAACIQLLMLSPMSRGLFQRTILMSGSAISPILPASTLNTLRNAKQIAAQLQCFSSSSNSQQHSSNYQFKDKDSFKDTHKDVYKDGNKDNYKENYKEKNSKSSKEHKSSELLDCLRRQKLDKLMDLQVKQPQFLFKYSPTMEGILFPIDPVKVMSDKQSTFLQYDLMIGVNSSPLKEFYNDQTNDASFLTDVDRKISVTSGPMTEEKRDKIIRTLVRNLYTYHLQEIYMTLSNEYRSSSNTSEEEERKLVELINDALLIAPSITTAMLHSKSQTKSTFVYNYAALEQLEMNDYRTSKSSNPTKKSIDKETLNSTTINEELSMLFGQPLVPSMKLIQRGFKRNYSNLEVKLSEILIKYWTHFAKTGDPNINQQTSSVNHRNHASSSTVNSLNNNVNGLSSMTNLKDSLPNSYTNLSNYSANDVIAIQQQKNQQRSEHWPPFNEYTQFYLNLNLHSTILDHMRSHQLSFFLNLLPKLNRPIANNMQMSEHHLLEDHHNLATYEGIVREHPAAGLNRNIALDLEDQLASKRMLELLLNGERQLTEQSNGDEKSKLNNLMKLREKLLKWKFISEQSNLETQQNYDDLIRKLTARIEGGENISSNNLLKRTNSSIIIEMDSNQVESGQELINNNLQQQPTNVNNQQQSNQLSQENSEQSNNNQDDEQQEETNSIQQNLKQINNPPNGHLPKLNDEQLNYQLRNKANESFSMIIQDGKYYSTALSAISIIFGCVLLILNILICAVHLNRNSRNRRTSNSPNSHNQSNSANLHLNASNNENLMNNSGLLVNNGQLNSASLNGQLKAYQANSIYLPCCEYDTTANQQQQCNATILTLKRNNSNKTYIAKTSTCGQLATGKHSIEGDYYLQQNGYSTDEHHLTINNNGLHNTLKNSPNDCLNNTTNFDQALANDALLMDKQTSSQTMDSSGLGSSLDNTSNTLTNNKLQINSALTNHLLHQQQLGNNMDLVNVSCSSAVSSSATMITSSPANTLTSTPDYYTTTNGLNHSSMLNQFNNINQSLNQSNNSSYLNHNFQPHHNFKSTNDQIQGLYGLYGHQTDHYVQLSNFDNLNNSNYHPIDTLNDPMNTLDSTQQCKSLMNSANHCNVISCSINQCDCKTSTNICKDA